MVGVAGVAGLTKGNRKMEKRKVNIKVITGQDWYITVSVPANWTDIKVREYLTEDEDGILWEEILNEGNPIHFGGDDFIDIIVGGPSEDEADLVIPSEDDD